MENKIIIAYITDENYVMPTHISIFSLIKNKKQEDILKIYLIGDNISSISKEQFRKLQEKKVEIKIIEVGKDKYISLGKTCFFSETIHVSATALFKMDLSELLCDEDKVIYIDGDTLIQGSLNELYKTDIESAFVAAVDDQFDVRIEEYSYLCGRIGLKRKHYFNSGVMLLNLKKMRQENISQRLLEYRTMGINYFMDQDCLNAVLGEKLITLPYVYNFMSTLSDVYDVAEIGKKFLNINIKSMEECISSAKILHLTDRKKPWIYNMPWYSEIFFRYYNQSLYKTEKIILKSPLKVLVNERQNLIRQLNQLTDRMEAVFPYEKIPKGSRVVIYGAGKMGQSYYRQILATQYCKLEAWVDKQGNRSAEGVDFPKKLQNVMYDYVIIAIANQQIVNEIKDYLKNTFGVDEIKIISKFEV